MLWQKLSPSHPHDVTASYVPAAQRILDAGWWAYATDIRALRISPLSAPWMALNNANPDQARVVHCVLSGLSVLLIALCAFVISGRTAMMAAGALWAFAPTVAQFASLALTEGPYAFLLIAWMLCALIYISHARTSALVAAIMLGGLAILMRPLPLYPMLFIGLCAVGMHRFWRSIDQALSLRISKLCLSTLMLPALMMTFNFANHRIFGLSTGAGGALYLGLHPLTAGVEADLLKFGPDVNAVVGLDHLTVEADRKLKRAAKQFAAQRSVKEWTQFALYKTKLLLVFDQVDLIEQPNDRGWRYGVFTLSALGLWHARKRLAVWWIAALGTLTGAQLLPLLNTPRYSVSALEPFLILTAALGAAAVFSGMRMEAASDRKQFALRLHSNHTSLARRVAMLFATLIGLGWIVHVGTRSAIEAANSISPGMNFKFNPRETVVLLAEPKILRSDGGTYDLNGTVRGEETVFAANYAVKLPKDIEKNLKHINAFWMFEFIAQGARGQDCKKFELAYVPAFERKSVIEVEPFSVARQGHAQRTIVSATQGRSKVSPASSGALRVLAHCPIGSSFKLNNLSLEISRIAASARSVANLSPAQ